MRLKPLLHITLLLCFTCACNRQKTPEIAVPGSNASQKPVAPAAEDGKENTQHIIVLRTLDPDNPVHETIQRELFYDDFCHARPTQLELLEKQLYRPLSAIFDGKDLNEEDKKHIRNLVHHEVFSEVEKLVETNKNGYEYRPTLQGEPYDKYLAALFEFWLLQKRVKPVIERDMSKLKMLFEDVNAALKPTLPYRDAFALRPPSPGGEVTYSSAPF